MDEIHDKSQQETLTCPNRISSVDIAILGEKRQKNIYSLLFQLLRIGESHIPLSLCNCCRKIVNGNLKFQNPPIHLGVLYLLAYRARDHNLKI